MDTDQLYGTFSSHFTSTYQQPLITQLSIFLLPMEALWQKVNDYIYAYGDEIDQVIII